MNEYTAIHPGIQGAGRQTGGRTGLPGTGSGGPAGRVCPQSVQVGQGGHADQG